ncbi:MAG: FtsW/RodA/SpoVE family cell cycle protein [Lentimicrobiaceae bacterium]|nr:FtsW/RodA/SpoVE family cell cycle protein [Lentimicrobiaceae bacterium]
MRKLQDIQGDKVIWVIVILLSILSLLAVYSSSGSLGYRRQGGNTEYYLAKHALILIGGLFLMFSIQKVRYQYFARLSVIGMLIVIPLLILTLFMGTNLNEASRWLTVPIVNVSFQTSDLAKLVLIVFTARMIAKRQDTIKDLKTGFLPIAIPAVMICLLILPANFSTAALLFFFCLVLMFIGKASMRHVFGLIGIGIVGLTLVIGILMFSEKSRIGTWQSRIESFVQGDTEEHGQIEQAKIAIAMGDIVGKGPGKSNQRNFLPHPYSDFIFAIIVEEYGLVGASILVLLYTILLYRGVRISSKSPSLFGSLLAIGIIFSIVFQAFINMAVAVNLLPVTGQPLPLISMGGTSVLFTCLALGLVLSVSRAADPPAQETVKAYETV